MTTLFGLLLVASMTINPAVMVTLQAHAIDELGRTAGEAALPFAMMVGLLASVVGVGNAISVAGTVGFAIVLIPSVRNPDLRQPA